MRLEISKILGRGFIVALLTLSSVGGLVYHDDALARSEKGEAASNAKAGNASDTGKANANGKSAVGRAGDNDDGGDPDY